MEAIVIHVEGMSCSHCENAVKKALGALEGVSEVKVDLKGKTVTVSYDPAKVTFDRMKSEIEDQGYDVV